MFYIGGLWGKLLVPHLGELRVPYNHPKHHFRGDFHNSDSSTWFLFAIEGQNLLSPWSKGPICASCSHGSMKRTAKNEPRRRISLERVSVARQS